MSDYFPQEIWVNILQRLSVRSLGRCACVCKAWKSHITDDEFIYRHFVRSIEANNGIESLHLPFSRPRMGAPICNDMEFYSLHLDDNKFTTCNDMEFYSLHLGNEKFDLFCTFKYRIYRLISTCSRVIGSCNGLVCLVDDANAYRDTFIIWNPSIKKCVRLPEPQVRCNSNENYEIGVGFGFDSRNKDFKVVRLVVVNPDTESLPPEVQVYSLASGSWRTITDTPPSFRGYSDLDGIEPQIFMNGIIHWIVFRGHNIILTFNVVEERFGEVMLPQPLKVSAGLVSIVEGGEKLSVAHTYRSELSIWVMEEYGVVGSWKEVFNSNSRQYGGILRVLALRNSGKLVLEVNSGHTTAIVSLDLRSNLVRNLDVRGGFWHAFVGYHVESLFLLNKEVTKNRKRKTIKENVVVSYTDKVWEHMVVRRSLQSR